MTTHIIPQSTRLNLRYCAENEPAPLDFVIPGLLAGTVGCVAAAGSTGKSFWSLEAAMGVTSGQADKSLLNLGIESHGRVVILNAEDPTQILHRRFHDACSFLSSAAREEVYEKLQIEVLMGTMPNIIDTKWQESVLNASAGARLVVFDTLTRWHRLDENDNGDMSQVLSVFEMICKETGAAVLFLHHVSKSMAKDGRQGEQQATRGAAAITDNARWQGWMQSMSESEAESYGIADDDRWRYVATGGNKENYGKETQKRWLERKKGGILIPVELKKNANEKQKKRGNNYV